MSNASNQLSTIIILSMVLYLASCIEQGSAVPQGQPEVPAAKIAIVVKQEEPITTTATENPIIEVCGESPSLKPGVPGSPGNLIESRINPNGQSELAHAMRVMLKELMENRDRLTKGEKASSASIAIHGKIRCAWPTVESMRGGAYEPMARQYLGEVVRYNSSVKGKAEHNRLVDACITCHKHTCDGPTIAIDAARVSIND